MAEQVGKPQILIAQSSARDGKAKVVRWTAFSTEKYLGVFDIDLIKMLVDKRPIRQSPTMDPIEDHQLVQSRGLPIPGPSGEYSIYNKPKANADGDGWTGSLPTLVDILFIEEDDFKEYAREVKLDLVEIEIDGLMMAPDESAVWLNIFHELYLEMPSAAVLGYSDFRWAFGYEDTMRSPTTQPILFAETGPVRLVGLAHRVPDPYASIEVTVEPVTNPGIVRAAKNLWIQRELLEELSIPEDRVKYEQALAHSKKAPAVGSIIPVSSEHLPEEIGPIFGTVLRNVAVYPEKPKATEGYSGAIKVKFYSEVEFFYETSEGKKSDRLYIPF